MKSDGIISRISITGFFEIIGGSLEEIFKKNQNAHDRFIKKEEVK